jgi:DNA-binding NarL/FixJ family response regulator
MTIRVLLADDEQLVRTGFRMILESTDDIEVVGEAVNGLEAVAAAARLHPDVVLMDVRMPVLDGIGATERLMSLDPVPRVVVLTTFDVDDYVHRALRSGASGFLLKDLSAAGLADAVRVAHSGEALLAPSATRRLIERYREAPPVDTSSVQSLTEREVDVLRAVVRGRNNKEIAADLFLAEPTVKTYVGRLLTKLDARDRVQLVILGYAMGLDRYQAAGGAGAN